MVSVISRVGNDVAGEKSRHVVLKIQHEIDNAVEPSLRKLDITVIREHGGLAEEAGSKGDAGCIKLRKMQLNDIMLPGQFCGDPAKGWRKHTFADPSYDRHTNHFDPVHYFFERKRRVVLIGHHGHLMAAFDEGAREALGINGQSAGVRAVVG